MTLYLLFAFFKGMSQENVDKYVIGENNKYGINFSIFSSGNIPWYIAPTFKLYFNDKHTVFIGPKFLINNTFIYSLNPPPIKRYVDRFTNKLGFITGYQFYPNRLSRKIDLFFEILTQYSYFKLGVNTGSNWIQIGKIHIINWSIGYGFKFKIRKNLYLNQSVGIGLFHDLVDMDIQDNINDNTEGAYNFKVSIGYDL